MEKAFGPPPEGPNLYTESGEEVYGFEASDFGNQPTWTKEELDGQPIIIRGLSTDTFDSDMGSARSVKYTLPTEPANQEPWGMFFSVESTIIQQVSKAISAGRYPFIAVLRKKESTLHRGQTYWTLEKYVRPANATPVLPPKKGK